MISWQSLSIVGVCWILLTGLFRVFFGKNRDNNSDPKELEDSEEILFPKKSNHFRNSNMKNKDLTEKPFASGKVSWVNNKTGEKTDLFDIKIDIENSKN
ncbi:hypothetical protein [Otariodibacter oris]|uniref:Uncharacterized protein n=1 Tax=Otariodibacter oris TaxID=1032623 RepID=A0A420XIE5_9PAST|nr:hypothetical protein [Otariodibacter oris]QGM80711.1 hypothetical protein A6A10_04475 [Otariodibacter oris]RKR77127.1 hypothetical protein DES31_0449 [Otariodibacter oris]